MSTDRETRRIAIERTRETVSVVLVLAFEVRDQLLEPARDVQVMDGTVGLEHIRERRVGLHDQRLLLPS